MISENKNIPLRVSIEQIADSYQEWRFLIEEVVPELVPMCGLHLPAHLQQELEAIGSDYSLTIARIRQVELRLLRFQNLIDLLFNDDGDAELFQIKPFADSPSELRPPTPSEKLSSTIGAKLTKIGDKWPAIKDSTTWWALYTVILLISLPFWGWYTAAIVVLGIVFGYFESEKDSKDARKPSFAPRRNVPLFLYSSDVPAKLRADALTLLKSVLLSEDDVEYESKRTELIESILEVKTALLPVGGLTGFIEAVRVRDVYVAHNNSNMLGTFGARLVRSVGNIEELLAANNYRSPKLQLACELLIESKTYVGYLAYKDAEALASLGEGLIELWQRDVRPYADLLNTHGEDYGKSLEWFHKYVDKEDWIEAALKYVHTCNDVTKVANIEFNNQMAAETRRAILIRENEEEQAYRQAVLSNQENILSSQQTNNVLTGLGLATSALTLLEIRDLNR